ncbi:DUF1330 domain-containing protein [Marinomonas algicola]|uniref:DUF1330 domain-containing protein n=1 Tax=Marinomonas algicola TaxID=2773454 RepID=UPI0017496E0E|nr:DUF1330 domain-containing protein [Marinomonas algicola]
MKVLAIVEINITDPSWIEVYSKNVTPLLLSYGGKYVTRSENIEIIEGSKKPQFSVVIEFPSRDVAMAFFNSAEYEPYKKLRHSGSESNYLLVNIENSVS